MKTLKIGLEVTAFVRGNTPVNCRMFRRGIYRQLETIIDKKRQDRPYHAPHPPHKQKTPEKLSEVIQLS